MLQWFFYVISKLLSARVNMQLNEPYFPQIIDTRDNYKSTSE